MLVDNINSFTTELEEAISASSDVPDIPPPEFAGHRIHTGRRGRPRIDINPHDLATFSVDRTRRTDIAAQYDSSARTIRRRLLEYGLSPPGPPVYEIITRADGTTFRSYMPGESSDLSSISDHDLDQAIASIYQQFPSFGRRMIDGYLLEAGHRVPRSRIIAAYARAIGPTTRLFAPRRLRRRVYTVPGPNSLWHHDGQHGTLRQDSNK